MAKKLILNPEIFTDPDIVGETEYRAVYEVLADGLEQANTEGTPKPEAEEFIKTILDEFKSLAAHGLKQLEKLPGTIEEKEE